MTAWLLLFSKKATNENYRPILLLAVGYRLFAPILLRRLRGTGAEDRIWTTQMGFRSNRGTGDAIFVARRLIEHAWATHDRSLLLLSLDWAKAFEALPQVLWSEPCKDIGSQRIFFFPHTFLLLPSLSTGQPATSGSHPSADPAVPGGFIARRPG